MNLTVVGFTFELNDFKGLFYINDSMFLYVSLIYSDLLYIWDSRKCWNEFLLLIFFHLQSWIELGFIVKKKGSNIPVVHCGKGQQNMCRCSSVQLIERLPKAWERHLFKLSAESFKRLVSFRRMPAYSQTRERERSRPNIQTSICLTHFELELFKLVAKLIQMLHHVSLSLHSAA